MLQFLKPISKTHSIRNVSATLFLAQNVLKVEALFNKLITADEIAKNYQRRNKTTIRTINIDGDKNILNNKQDNTNGFVFESFDGIGRLDNILRLINQNESTTALTFETRQYQNWSEFLNRLISDVKLVSNHYKFFVSAISLNYVDEFTWVSADKIPVRDIFNIESELINEKFLNSGNASLILHSQTGENNDAYEERTEISFGNRVKKIIINHQYAKTFDNLEESEEVLSSNILQKYFQEAHDVNKNILKTILSEDVLKLINLK